MKNQFVETLQDGDTVNSPFVAARNDLRNKQNGGQFLGMVFKDRSGEIGGIMWNNAAQTSRLFAVGDVVNVRGRVQTYQNRLQIQVDQILPLGADDYSLEDMVFTPAESRADYDRLRAILDTVENPWLKKLLDVFWNDADFVSRFTMAAAAKRWHHEYRGGLVRHCYEMARIAETMCELFARIDRGVLLLGVFLHDLGKLREMRHDLCVDYTTEGRLIGHLQIGCEILDTKIAEIPDFPSKLRLELTHMILSHHGELQFGSPVVPKTLEAIVLHHIDNLDAQATAFGRVIGEARANGQAWSDYLPLIERVIWTKDGE